MNILADESVDQSVVDRLRADGHAVPFVTEMAPGIPDSQVLAEANGRGAMLLTADKDFGEMVFRQRQVHAGVILLRFAGVPNWAKAEIAAAAIATHCDELSGTFAVIQPGRIRIRRTPL